MASSHQQLIIFLLKVEACTKSQQSWTREGWKRPEQYDNGNCYRPKRGKLLLSMNMALEMLIHRKREAVGSSIWRFWKKKMSLLYVSIEKWIKNLSFDFFQLLILRWYYRVVFFNTKRKENWFYSWNRFCLCYMILQNKKNWTRT